MKRAEDEPAFPLNRLRGQALCFENLSFDRIIASYSSVPFLGTTCRGTIFDIPQKSTSSPIMSSPASGTPLRHLSTRSSSSSHCSKPTPPGVPQQSLSPLTSFSGSLQSTMSVKWSWQHTCVPSLTDFIPTTATARGLGSVVGLSRLYHLHSPRGRIRSTH